MPDEILRNSDLEDILQTSDEWIRTRTGILERRRASDDQCTSDLGYEASLKALADAGLAAADLDLIICATSTPEMLLPATACLIQARMGASRAAAFDLLVACSGFAYAVATAAQFIGTGVYEHVLVVGADVMSRVVDWDDRSTAVLFGDGAGAVVLGPVDEGSGLLGFHLGADGTGGSLLEIGSGVRRFPPGSEAASRQEPILRMAGREVFRFAVTAMGDAAVAALEQAGLAADDVDLFIPHQANIRIIEAARRRLGIAPERVFINVDRYGNTSCASIPMALSEARDQGRLKEGDVVVAVGFGGGLSWGATVIRWGGVRATSR